MPQFVCLEIYPHLFNLKLQVARYRNASDGHMGIITVHGSSPLLQCMLGHISMSSSTGFATACLTADCSHDTLPLFYMLMS